MCDKQTVLMVDVLQYITPTEFGEYMRGGRRVLALQWNHTQAVNSTMCQGECVLQGSGDTTTHIWTDVGRDISYTHAPFNPDDYCIEGVEGKCIISLLGYELWEFKSESDEPSTPPNTDLLSRSFDSPEYKSLKSASDSCSVTYEVGSSVSTRKQQTQNSLDECQEVYEQFLTRTATGPNGEKLLSRDLISKLIGQPMASVQRMLFEHVPKFCDDPIEAYRIVGCIVPYMAHNMEVSRFNFDEDVSSVIGGHDSYVKDPGLIASQESLSTALWQYCHRWWQRKSAQTSAMVYRSITGMTIPAKTRSTM
jgi:hypothetical protein